VLHVPPVWGHHELRLMKHRIFYRGFWLDKYMAPSLLMAAMDAIDRLLRPRYS